MFSLFAWWLLSCDGVILEQGWLCPAKSGANQSSKNVTQYDFTPCAGPSGPVVVSGQDLTEDEEAETVDEDVVDDTAAEDEDDEAEVEDDENTELVSWCEEKNVCFLSFVYLKP